MKYKYLGWIAAVVLSALFIACAKDETAIPDPGTSHRNHRKIKEFIFLIINYLNISYFLYFCHILPIFRYSVHF